MIPLFRLLLIFGSISTALFFLIKIRRSKIQIEDTIFWLVFSAAIFILSIFPGILSVCAILFGVQSPVNFLFLVVIFTLLLRLFKLTIKVSMLENELKQFAREYALNKVAEDPAKEIDK